MDNLFIINPKISNFDLQNGIDARLNKAKAIGQCVAVDIFEEDSSLAHNEVTNALWALDGLLEEVSLLQETQYKKIVANRKRHDDEEEDE